MAGNTYRRSRPANDLDLGHVLETDGIKRVLDSGDHAARGSGAIRVQHVADRWSGKARLEPEHRTGLEKSRACRFETG